MLLSDIADSGIGPKILRDSGRAKNRHPIPLT
jgi:hypothetical protein